MDKFSTQNAKMRNIHKKFITFFAKTIDEMGKMGYINSVPISTQPLQVLKFRGKV
jgi:hypothetical protein